MAFAQVQNGPNSNGTSSVTVTLSAASTAGNHLVAVVEQLAGTAFTGPGTGWALAAWAKAGAAQRVEIWYYPSNPGGITTAAFTGATGIVCRGHMAEYSSAAGTTMGLTGLPGGNSSSAPLPLLGTSSYTAGNGGAGFPSTVFPVATPIPAAMGATIGTLNFEGSPWNNSSTDYWADAQLFDGFLTDTAAYASQASGTRAPAETVQKIYWGGGGVSAWWTTLPGWLTTLISNGVKILACPKPDPALTTADKGNLATMISLLQSHNATFDVCLYHEPNDNFATAADFKTYVAYYASTVTGAGVNLVYNPAINSGSNGNDTWVKDAYPPQCNIVIADLYCNAIINQHRTLDALASVGGGNLPIGMGEWNSNAGTSTALANADFVTAVNYLLTFFRSRAAQGKPSAYNLFWMGDHAVTQNTVNQILSSSDPQVPAVRQYYDAFRPGPVIPAGGLGIAAFGAAFSTATTGQVWTAPSGWTIARSQGNVSGCYCSVFQTGMAAGLAQVTGQYGSSANQTAWASAVAVFSEVSTTAPVSSPFTFVQGTGAPTGSSGTLTLTLPVASTAGTLLGAVISMNDGVQTVTAPAGWVLAADRSSGAGTTNTSRSQIWYYPANPGSISSAAFTYTNTTGAIHGTMMEFSAPAGTVVHADQPGGGTGTGTSATVTGTCASLNAYSNGLAIGNWASAFNPAGGSDSLSTPAGWTRVQVNNHIACVSLAGYQTGITTGPTSGTSNQANTTGEQSWSAALATFYAVATTPPSILTTGQLPDASNGVAYSYTLAATGGSPPYTWAVTSGALPAGLSLSSGGVISGTSTAAGLASFTVTLTDASAQTGAAALQLQVSSLAVTTTSPLPGGTTGTPYSQALAATGGTGPYTWAVTSGALPAGLGLSPGGAVAGTPLTTGTFTFTATVTDAHAAVASKSFTATVTGGSLIILTAALAPGTLGQPYTAQLQATGGTPPYTWALAAGSLPPGLTLNSNGSVTGTLLGAGDYPFTVQVTDSS